MCTATQNMTSSDITGEWIQGPRCRADGLYGSSPSVWPMIKSGTCSRFLKWSAEGLSRLAPPVISIPKSIATHNSFCGVLNGP